MEIGITILEDQDPDQNVGKFSLMNKSEKQSFSSKKFGSPCIRCGKTRIFSKRWVDKSGPGEPVTHEIYVCPDKDCQAIVSADFEAKRQKRLLLSANRNSGTKTQGTNLLTAAAK